MAVTLVKEDGTGLANANSYADAADALLYMEQTGRKEAWAALTGNARLSALINATAYMDDTYGSRYLGDRVVATEDTQALDWPREGVLYSSGAVILPTDIPPEIGEACMEFALIDATAGLNPNPAYDASGRAVDYSRVLVVGAVEKETHFGGSPSPTARRRYPVAERVLRKYLRASSGRLLLRA